jgi:hypothetical protein
MPDLVRLRESMPEAGRVRAIALLWRKDGRSIHLIPSDRWLRLSMRSGQDGDHTQIRAIGRHDSPLGRRNASALGQLPMVDIFRKKVSTIGEPRPRHVPETSPGGDTGICDRAPVRSAIGEHVLAKGPLIVDHDRIIPNQGHAIRQSELARPRSPAPDPVLERPILREYTDLSR